MTVGGEGGQDGQCAEGGGIRPVRERGEHGRAVAAFYLGLHLGIGAGAWVLALLPIAAALLALRLPKRPPANPARKP